MALVGLLFAQSVVHSLYKDSAKALLFLLLRLVKYLLFLTMLSMLMGFLDNALTITIALPLVIPYVAFVSFSYAKQKSLIRSVSVARFGASPTSLALLFLALLPIYSLYLSETLTRSAFYVIGSIFFGYLSVVVPFFGMRRVLRYFFGSENIDFHNHVKRLLTGALLTTTIVICEIIALDLFAT